MAYDRDDADARREYQVETDMDEASEVEVLAQELGYTSADEMNEAQQERAEQDRDYHQAFGV